MNVLFENTDLNQLQEIAKKILETSNSKIFVFYGEMGSGKTTLIKHLISTMSDDVLSSPTYSIVNEYLSQKGTPIFHFDFYRIQNQEEALMMGCEEYFSSGEYCFVEWAENIPDLIPDNVTKIIMKKNKENRDIEINY